MTDTLQANFASQVLHAHDKLINWRALMQQKNRHVTREPAWIWSGALTDIDVFRQWAVDVQRFVLQHRIDGPLPANIVPVCSAVEGVQILVFNPSAQCAQVMETYRVRHHRERIFTKIPRTGNAIVKVAYPMARSITLYAEVYLECRSNHQLNQSIYIPIISVEGSILDLSPPLMFPSTLSISVGIDICPWFIESPFCTQVFTHFYDVETSRRIANVRNNDIPRTNPDVIIDAK